MTESYLQHFISDLLFAETDMPDHYRYIKDNDGVKQNVYAIVNAAGSDKLLMNLVAYEPEYRILYNDKDAETLEDAAPWLVKLNQGESYTEWLFEECLGQRLLLFLQSSKNIDQLAHHFKFYTKIEFPNKCHPENYQIGFFSFYDPSIFPTWAKSLSQEEAERFFNPINNVWCEEGSQLKLLYLLGKGWKQCNFDLNADLDQKTGVIS